MSKRKIISNVILLLFMALVSTAALFSDIFKVNTKNGSEALDQARLFTANELSLTKRISLKNKSGEYIFERNENDKNTPWHMITPLDISANSLFIEKLFSALTVIKIKKQLPDEKINNSNFSLDKPTATLTISDQDGKTIMIQFGLMNTIDNSIYLKISGRAGIYHVDAPNVSLENATLADLSESQVFSISSSSTESVSITHIARKTNEPPFDIHKVNGNWFDHNNAPLGSDKVDDFFQELANLKSSYIIDKPNDSQKKLINTLSKNAEYSLMITDNKTNRIEYKMSTLIKDFSEIDLKNEEHFMITQSSTATVYLVKKEFLELFNRKMESFKIKTVPETKK